MSVDANVGSGLEGPFDVPVTQRADDEPTVTSPEMLEIGRRLEELLPTLNRHVLGTPSDHPIAALPLAQLRLCTLLLREGRRTMSQIGDDLGISVSAVTQMADRLGKAGMVERVAETGGDRRTRHLQLTPHGAGLMTSRRASRIARAASILSTLEPAQRQEVVDALVTLLEASRVFPDLTAAAMLHSEPNL
jgi:DNA-binding MarR family transcriptional regulator